MNPLISVIIPVYNGEAYLRDCINNMLEQSYKNLEIIIVDDGSTDNTATIAAEHPVRYLPLKRNQGISVARNTGVENAKGEYIHFMDVDDTINTDFYLEMASAITETGSDIACCGMINEPKPHRTILFEKREVFTTTDDKFKVTNVGKWGFAVRYLFRTDFLNQNNLRFMEGRYIQDLPFSLTAVYYAKKMVVVPHAVYTYILRENSVTTRKGRSHHKKRHQDLRFAREYRHHFARKHNFKIPGIPTGRFSLFFVKWFT